MPNKSEIELNDTDTVDTLACIALASFAPRLAPGPRRPRITEQTRHGQFYGSFLDALALPQCDDAVWVSQLATSTNRITDRTHTFTIISVPSLTTRWPSRCGPSDTSGLPPGARAVGITKPGSWNRQRGFQTRRNRATEPLSPVQWSRGFRKCLNAEARDVFGAFCKHLEQSPESEELGATAETPAVIPPAPAPETPPGQA